MRAPDYMTVKELKEILANIPDNLYACVDGGEDCGGEWVELYISPTIPDHCWDRNDEHMTILKY